jgi:hypothetical protein
LVHCASLLGKVRCASRVSWLRTRRRSPPFR